MVVNYNFILLGDLNLNYANTSHPFSLLIDWDLVMSQNIGLSLA